MSWIPCKGEANYIFVCPSSSFRDSFSGSSRKFCHRGILSRRRRLGRKGTRASLPAVVNPCSPEDISHPLFAKEETEEQRGANASSEIQSLLKKRCAEKDSPIVLSNEREIAKAMAVCRKVSKRGSAKQQQPDFQSKGELK